MAMYSEHTVAGLKQAIGKQANIRRSVEATLEEMKSLFATSLGMMFEVGIDIEPLVWQFVKVNEPWWQGESARVGVLTRIGDYTNKHGFVSKVHFSENGNYIKKAQAGDQPCSYIGYFRVTQAGFKYNLFKKDAQWMLSFEPK